MLASATVDHVFGLPAAAAAVAPPQTIDAQPCSTPSRACRLARAWPRPPGCATSRAGAPRPTTPVRTSRPRARSSSRSCSACSRATSADPLRSSSWSLERALVLDSSNRAANELLPRAGGAGGGRRRWSARSARPRTFTCCGYLLEAGERRRTRARRFAAPLPPTTVVDQPTFPCCKYTTAHDLGTLLVSLMLAAIGPRPRSAARHHGARGARRALAARARELSRARSTGRRRSPSATRRAGCRDIQHDAALVFTPHGTLVAVFMNYSPGGVCYARVRDAAGDVVRLALRRSG